MPVSAQTFVNSRDQARKFHQSTENALASQPSRSHSQSRQLNANGSFDELVDRRRDLENLKMPVPTTTLNREVGASTAANDVAGLATHVAAGRSLQRPRSEMKQLPRRRQHLDDTESFRSTTGSDYGDYQERQADYDHGYSCYAQTKVGQRGMGSRSKDPRQTTATVVEDGFARVLGPNWRQEAEAEKRRQSGLGPSHGRDEQHEYVADGPFDSDEDEVDEEGYEEDDVHQQLNVQETPSKPQSAPPMPPPHQKATANALRPSTALLPASLPETQIKHSTRSSSRASTEEESLPSASLESKKSTKHPRDEVTSLDYEPAQLKGMTYADLDKVAYTTDPRAPMPKPAVDEHGVPLNLSSKLGNMSRMQEQDIRAVFETQTDAEREETGKWFLAEMTEMMKRVDKTRLERRKVALKFEMEVKKRQRMVEARVKEVDGELSELRKGGGDLISKRVGVAPRDGTADAVDWHG